MPEINPFAELATQLTPELKEKIGKMGPEEQKRLTDIEEQRKQATVQAEQEYNKQIEERRKKEEEISGAFRETGEYFAKPPVYQPEPEVPKYEDYFNPTIVQGLFTVASIFAAISGFRGAEHGSNAIDFLTGAINGYLGGSERRAVFGLQQYHNELGKAVRANQRILDEYERIGQSKKLTLEQKLSEFHFMAERHQIGNQYLRDKMRDDANFSFKMFEAIQSHNEKALNQVMQWESLRITKRHYGAIEGRAEREERLAEDLVNRSMGFDVRNPEIQKLTPEEAERVYTMRFGKGAGLQEKPEKALTKEEQKNFLDAVAQAQKSPEYKALKTDQQKMTYLQATVGDAFSVTIIGSPKKPVPVRETGRRYTPRKTAAPIEGVTPKGTKYKELK